MRQIKLTRGQFALVDDEDYEYLSQFKWQVTINKNKPNSYYATRSFPINGVWKSIGMHREIMNASANTLVDHIDGNSLNNQKQNLRICTQAENLRNRGKNKSNTSGYKGVYFNGKKWIAKIKSNYVSYSLGTFPTPEMAARAYDEKAKELHGSFANLNFPEGK